VDPLEEMLAGIRQELARQNEARPPVLPQDDPRQHERRGSRFVAPGADESVVEHVAAGGAIRVAEPQQRLREHERRSGGLAGTMTKALAEATPSAGGYLVPTEVAEEVMRMVRARSAVMALGPRVVPVKKELAITSLASGATAAYVAENAPIPTSEQTFAQAVLLAPKELAALVPVSNRLLRDAASNPDVEAVIRDDRAEVSALRADLAFIGGTGAAGSPVGVVNTTRITPRPDLGADGDTPTFDDLKLMVSNCGP
jgi:HK97 family phage major capsid protein